MSNLNQHVFDSLITVLRDGLQRGSKLVAKIGRHADRVPVEFDIPVMQSSTLCFGQVKQHLKQVEDTAFECRVRVRQWGLQKHR